MKIREKELARDALAERTEWRERISGLHDVLHRTTLLHSGQKFE